MKFTAQVKQFSNTCSFQSFRPALTSKALTSEAVPSKSSQPLPFSSCANRQVSTQGSPLPAELVTTGLRQNICSAKEDLSLTLN